MMRSKSLDLLRERARRVPIRDVARRLGLREQIKRGHEWVVLCPGHDDRNPSCRLNTTKNRWYCDVCSDGGDTIALAMIAKGVDFVEAARWVVYGD
jgi:DNA primase